MLNRLYTECNTGGKGGKTYGGGRGEVTKTATDYENVSVCLCVMVIGPLTCCLFVSSSVIYLCLSVCLLVFLYHSCTLCVNQKHLKCRFVVSLISVGYDNLEINLFL